MNSFHTLELCVNRKFTITKPLWDEVDVQMIDRACDPKATADIAAVVMSEGLANICLVSDSMTIVRQKVECAIPRKRVSAAFGHDKAVNKFHEQVLQAMLQHVDLSLVKVVIVASPGFVKDEFMEFVWLEAQRRELKELLESKPKFVLAHSSSGHKHALDEVIADPSMANKLADTKAARDMRLLSEFYQMLNDDPDRAFYGWKHCETADEQGAIEKLLVADKLFRNRDLNERRKYVAMVENVQSMGGQVCMFSSLHHSGVQLDQLTGIAAILRFPVEMEQEDEDSESSEPEDDYYQRFHNVQPAVAEQ
eukprot:TRINITY_DN7303_c0_g1_i2.p1 TRINITY_DN7303_c0_g1~~TRINITY_DN7303_c0_g1_i2.p1  ORF type:complete len:308 (-),score=85.32 TRINITY_DN7303_c0_g1_i2:4-927(-)